MEESAHDGPSDHEERARRLIGAGIQASRSPALHMREGAENGLSYRYELIDTAVLGVGPEALPALLDEAEKRGFAG